jgi:hypothetical protein
MRSVLAHLGVALLGVTTIAASASTGQAGRVLHSATYNILLKGVRIGFETVTVTETGAGRQISSSGRLGPPIDLTTARFELAYANDWQPQQLTIEGVLRGQLFTLSATFGLTTASVDVMQSGQKRAAVQDISPRTVVLPNNFYGAYEALATRLAAAPVGTRLPVYVAPEIEISVTVGAISARRLSTPAGPVDLRQVDVTFSNPLGAIAAEIWVDTDGHLARLVMPSQALTVMREDLSSVMTREERIRNAGDEDAFIPAAGFNLASTITRPANAAGRLPAVVLVGGSGPEDRDEAVGGIPIFGQLAGALASDGFLVVRFDKRGIGQSGGRTESATIHSYADDVVNIISWLRRRKDIDTDRLAVVGYSEGGALALLAAGRETHIRAIALLATSGRNGRDLSLEQQQHELARLNLADADRQAKVALQQRLLDASITGKGWESLPPGLRREVDTPWLKSWLLFDPAAAMKKVGQPVLILQGSLDRQMPPAHADRLEALSLARGKTAGTRTRKVIVPGVNHLLVQATTGEVDEFPSLPVRVISPDVVAALSAWLREQLAPKR